ncbi:HlyD family secretion protein [Tangfeifania diversioriginum]|uniref:HlyD family secretion protein n=1 Tax=Tangfeifania diversioriginum TaxID=1168035 RepID=A0A1M6AWS2_9BACT|nr:efflux RND transporter periplasmic adaptor subunit [Tangfeifania diversioriginum]SHI40897.1 HlyD family secretion protein [Tangfeifania diversioriginum]
MKKKKLLPYAIGLLVIVIVFLVIGKNQGWFGEDFTISVAVEKVESKTITEFITANGKIQPETEVKISPDVSGEIIELYVEEGDEVEAGDPLCVIKPDMYISALNRAEAALNSSKARLAQAEAQLIERELSFKRAQQLFDSGTIPVSEYESAESAYKVAQAEVRAAEFSVKSADASVEEAQEQLTKTRIFAPISGTISALNVEKGERVVGTSMMTGTDMMVVADLERMEVLAEVNENDIVRVSLNDTALVEVDAYLSRDFKGVVTEIANSASISGAATDQVTNFDVKVFLLPGSYVDLIDSTASNIYPFRPGMSANIDILTETRDNVISVPISAVTTRVKDEAKSNAQANTDETATPTPDEKLEVVFVYQNGIVRQKEVKTGIQDNTSIEILEGLSEGDEVVVAPYNAVSKTLNDSTSVKVVSEEELFGGE